jgi:methylmalonyl-CoA/ethylmalonyl-CoA epimerase
MADAVHHINFLVRDLDVASAKFAAVLGLGEPLREELPQRGVVTARFRIGGTWIVLVQPTSSDSVPGRRLAQYGEGLFLVSLGVPDIDAAMRDLAARGAVFTSAAPRAGLSGWRVIDIEPACLAGIEVQICEDSAD